jgi:hypothetical protein
VTDDIPELDLVASRSVEDLSDYWLSQAVIQFIDSLGATAERSLKAALEGEQDQRPGFGYFQARLVGARHSMVFSAFAAEAYVNRFLHNRLSGRDLKTALDMRPPAEKFAAGTRLALGKTLFPRDDPTYQSLKALFALRNRLVHARPRPIEPEEVLDQRAYRDFNPLATLDYLVTVASAARTLLAAHDPPAASGVTELALYLPAMRGVAEGVTQDPIPSEAEVRAEVEEAKAAHPQFFLDTDASS